MPDLDLDHPWGLAAEAAIEIARRCEQAGRSIDPRITRSVFDVLTLAYLRDTAQVLSVILIFWFWVTPIFFTEQQMPARFRFLLRLNPLSFLVRAYRDRLLSSRVPSLHDFMILSAYAITAFVAGGLCFRHLKRGFADVL